MDFSLIDFLDQAACYHKLVAVLHPDGLACPHCGEKQRLGIHRRHRNPVLDYQCAACSRVFNAWTGTTLEGTHRRPAQILWILRGITQATPTAQLARELGCDRRWLLSLRHRLQEYARRWLDRNPLGDDEVEADERVASVSGLLVLVCPGQSGSGQWSSLQSNSTGPWRV